MLSTTLKVQEWVSFKSIDLGDTTSFKNMDQAAKMLNVRMKVEVWPKGLLESARVDI